MLSLLLTVILSFGLCRLAGSHSSQKPKRTVEWHVGESGTDGIFITLTGPADRWFSLAFGAEKMADLPHAIVVAANGSVSERKLAAHLPGSLIPAQVNVLASEVVKGKRTLKLNRTKLGLTTDHFDFTAVAENSHGHRMINYIWAEGADAGTEYKIHGEVHGAKTLGLGVASDVHATCYVNIGPFAIALSMPWML